MSGPGAHRRPPGGFDLLRIPTVKRLILWSGFPYAFQVAALVVFLTLLLSGWGQYPPAGVNARHFAKANLVTLLVWGIWWPAMICASVLLGRAWCTLCPVELVSNGSERLGRWLGLRQRSLPRWVAAGSVIVALYALIQLLVAGAHINRVPAYTALFLLGLLGLAFASGLRRFLRGVHGQRLPEGLQPDPARCPQLSESAQPAAAEQQPRLPRLRPVHQGLPARQHEASVAAAFPVRGRPRAPGELADHAVRDARVRFRDLGAARGMAPGRGILPRGATMGGDSARPGDVSRSRSRWWSRQGT